MSWRSSVAIAMPISRTLGQAVQPGPELLDRLQLGRPGRHLLEVLGGPDRDAGLGRERRHRLELVVASRVRLVVVDVEQAEQRGRRRAAARVQIVSKPSWTTAARTSAPARVVAVVDGEQRSARRRSAAAGSDRAGKSRTRDEVRRRQAAADLGAMTVPSGWRRKTAPRSASNSTMAWSTSPERIRSRSSRLPMSPATRRSASARWSWWATSSSRCADADDRADRRRR